MAQPAEISRHRDGQPQPNPFMDAVVKRIGERDVPNAAVGVLANLGKSYRGALINARRTATAIPQRPVPDTYWQEQAVGLSFVLCVLGQEAVAKVAEDEIATSYPGSSELIEIFSSPRPMRPDAFRDAVTPQIEEQDTPHAAAVVIGGMGKMYTRNLIDYHLSVIDHELDNNHPINTAAQEQVDGHQFVLEALGQTNHGSVIDRAETNAMAQIQRLRGRTISFS